MGFSTKTQYGIDPTSGNAWSYSPTPFYKRPSFWGSMAGGMFGGPMGAALGRIGGGILSRQTGIGRSGLVDLGPIRIPTRNVPAPALYGYIPDSSGMYAAPASSPWTAGTIPAMDDSAMYASTAPTSGGIYTALPAQPNSGLRSTLNPFTPYGSSFDPNAFGGGFDAGQRFFGEFGGGLRDGDPTTSGVCFSGNTRLKDLGRFDQFSADQIVTLPDGRKAQVLIHDHNGPMRDMGNDELVTPDHPFQHDGQLVPASALFPDEVPFTGKVYNLHILTDQESERLYDLENGHRVHNKIPLASLTGSALSWFQ